MKKKYLLLIVILVCVLIVAIFVLFGFQKKEETTNKVENSVNEGNTVSLRNQIMNGGNTEIQNTTISTKIEDLEKYNKENDENYTTYKDSSGLSFMYPSNWLSIGTEEEPVFMSSDGKGAIASATNDEMSEDTTVVTDFDSYMGFQKLYLRQNTVMLSDIEEKQVNLNGKKAYILNYVAERGEESAKMNLNVTQVAFVDQINKVYILTLFVVDDYYKDYEQIFNKMIKSFIRE